MISWSWFALSGQAGGTIILCSLLVHLGLHIILPSLSLTSLRLCFFMWGYFRTLSVCQFLLYLISKLTFRSRLYPCSRHSLLQSVRSCPFAKITFVPMATHNCGKFVMLFGVTCCLFIILELIYFLLSNFHF